MSSLLAAVPRSGSAGGSSHGGTPQSSPSLLARRSPTAAVTGSAAHVTPLVLPGYDPSDQSLRPRRDFAAPPASELPPATAVFGSTSGPALFLDGTVAPTDTNLIPQPLPTSALLHVLTTSEGRDKAFKLVQYSLKLAIGLLKLQEFLPADMEGAALYWQERLAHNAQTVRNGRSMFKLGRWILTAMHLQAVLQQLADSHRRAPALSPQQQREGHEHEQEPRKAHGHRQAGRARRRDRANSLMFPGVEGELDPCGPLSRRRKTKQLQPAQAGSERLGGGDSPTDRKVTFNLRHIEASMAESPFADPTGAAFLDQTTSSSSSSSSSSSDGSGSSDESDCDGAGGSGGVGASIAADEAAGSSSHHHHHHHRHAAGGPGGAPLSAVHAGRIVRFSKSYLLAEFRPLSDAAPCRHRRAPADAPRLGLLLMALRCVLSIARNVLRDGLYMSDKTLFSVSLAPAARVACQAYANVLWLLVSAIDLALNSHRLFRRSWIAAASTADSRYYCKCNLLVDGEDSDVMWVSIDPNFVRSPADLEYPELDLEWGAAQPVTAAFFEAAPPRRIRAACKKCACLLQRVPMSDYVPKKHVPLLAQLLGRPDPMLVRNLSRAAVPLSSASALPIPGQPAQPPPQQPALTHSGARAHEQRQVMVVPFVIRAVRALWECGADHANFHETILLQLRYAADVFLASGYVFGAYEPGPDAISAQQHTHIAGSVAGLISAAVALRRVTLSAK